MVGVSLALLLAAHPQPWRVLVVEAHPQQLDDNNYITGFDARSTALSYSTREIFEAIDLWSMLVQQAEPISQIQISDRGHIAATQLHASEQNFDAYGYVIENHCLRVVLNKALANTTVDIAAPVTADQVTVVRDGVELKLSDRKRLVRCKLLVVADGACSSTRDKLGISARVSDYGQMALIANIALAEPHGGVAYERFTEQGPMALLPLVNSGGRYRSALVWSLPPKRAEHLQNCSGDEFLTQLQDQFGYRQGQLIGVGERQAYPLKLIETNEQVRRSVVVVGNAAHSLHPVAGQGFNLALRDIAVLAETLSKGAEQGQAPGELALLQQYLDYRQADQQRTLAVSDWLPKIFTAASPAAAVARGAGLLAVDMIPGVRGQFARYGMGLE